MSKNDSISMSVIRRLPRYYRFLSELNDQNIDKISSTKLAQIMNVTASQAAGLRLQRKSAERGNQEHFGT